MNLSLANLPSADFLLIAGRAVFLVFSFVVAAVSFTACVPNVSSIVSSPPS